MRLSGELTHPDIDYTPHYGIERNIGIETGLTLNQVLEEYGDPGIVTTRFIPKYPSVGPVITLQGRSISRTNAPISTHGVIYILGIGTAGNGVGVMKRKEISMESNSVRRKDSFQQQRLVLDLFYSTSRQLVQKQDQFLYLDTMETTKIQAHLVKLLFVKKVASSLKRRSSRSTKQMVLEHLLTVVLLKTKQQHSPKLVLVLYSQSVVSQRVQLVRPEQVLVVEHPYSMERQILLLCTDSRRYCNTYTIWYRDFITNADSSTMDLELSHSEETSILLQVFVYLTTDLVHSVYLVVLQNQQSNHLLQEVAILTDITGVAETRKISVFQDFVPSGTFTIFGELTHPDIDYTPAYTGIGNVTISGIGWGEQNFQRSDLVLQHSLVLLFSDLQQIPSRVQSSSIQKEHLHLRNMPSIKFTDTTETTKIQAHLVLQQYLVFLQPERYLSSKTLFHQEHLQYSILHLYTQTFVTFRQLVLGWFFIRQVEQLSNPSEKATTQLKDPLRDSLDLKNLLLVQLTLVLVNLIPLALVKLNTSSSSKVEPTLLLFNSYK